MGFDLQQRQEILLACEMSGTGCGAHPVLCSVGTACSFCRGKGDGREDPSPVDL